MCGMQNQTLTATFGFIIPDGPIYCTAEKDAARGVLGNGQVVCFDASRQVGNPLWRTRFSVLTEGGSITGPRDFVDE